MRTTLDIDDDLLRALMARHPGATKREAVEVAIRSYITADAAARTKMLGGKLRIDDVSAPMRKRDRST